MNLHQCQMEGLSTNPERKVYKEPRSKAHHWTAHTIFEYFVLCGIEPREPETTKPCPGRVFFEVGSGLEPL